MTLPRRWRILGYLCGSITILTAFAWLYLYLDSIHQRHRAEALIADLRSFPFESATFTTVRDFTLAHGGEPMRVPELQQDPHIPFPPHLNWTPASEYDRVCTPQDCAFVILIRNRTSTLPLPFSVARPIILSLRTLGIRTWSVNIWFDVVHNHLARSSTDVFATLEGPPALDGSRSFESVQYSAYSISPAGRESYPPYNLPVGQTYAVSTRFYTKSPRSALQTHFLQLPSAPVSRAYDINLHCLTAITSSCTLAQLAPTAWSDLPKPQN